MMHPTIVSDAMAESFREADRAQALMTDEHRRWFAAHPLNDVRRISAVLERLKATSADYAAVRESLAFLALK
jgi:hypothetical protein